MQLSFKILRIPVRILPSFLITTVILNFGLAENDLRRFVLWTVIVAASVLAHELGHAAAGLAFGLQPRIDLHGFGGTTSWSSALPVSRVRRIVISLAGPAMGFLGAALVVVVGGVFGPGLAYFDRALPAAFGLAAPLPERSLGDYVYASLLFVNIGWGLINLLPILPLDGGEVLAQTIALTGRGERPARIISIVMALLAMIGALLLWMFGAWGGGWWPVLLAATFAATNWQALKASAARPPPEPVPDTAVTPAITPPDAAPGSGRDAPSSHPGVRGG